MATCFNCKSQYPVAALFCPSCGSVPESPARESYSGSILLGVALLALILVWQVASLTPTSGENQAPVAPEPRMKQPRWLTVVGVPIWTGSAQITKFKSQVVSCSTERLGWRQCLITAVLLHGHGDLRLWLMREHWSRLLPTSSRGVYPVLTSDTSCRGVCPCLVYRQ